VIAGQADGSLQVDGVVNTVGGGLCRGIEIEKKQNTKTCSKTDRDFVDHRETPAANLSETHRGFVSAHRPGEKKFEKFRAGGTFVLALRVKWKDTEIRWLRF